jgi:hypothetical protein
MRRPMQRRVFFVLLWGALGCRPAAPTAAPVTPPAVAAFSPPSTTTAATLPVTESAPSEPQPASVSEFPSRPTCVLETARWRSRGKATELSLASGGPVFAQFTAPRAVLHLMPGMASAGAKVELENEGLVLRGLVAGEAFRLRPARAFVMGGFLIPTMFAELIWTESEGTDILVSYDLGPSVQVVQKPLLAKLACADVTIDSAAFKPEALAGLAESTKDGLLRTGQPIALGTKPESAPVAWLNASDDRAALVKVGRQEQGKTLIWWWRDTALVFGWVSSSDLQKREALPGVGYGGGTGVPSLLRSKAVIATARCQKDVPVVAEVGAKRATVGLIRTGTLIEILERNESESTVQTKSPFIATFPGARLLVDARTLDQCGAQ